MIHQRLKRPNFLIVGAPKCGTTTLYDSLRQHPEIYMPGLKEPHFFCDGLGVEDWQQYLALFGRARHARVGEASTNYLYAAEAPERIYRRLGGVAIVAVLRDPVDQMYSMYQHNRTAGLERLSFQAALAAETWRRRQGEPAKLYYRARARYSGQLQRYLSIFGRDHVQVLIFEEMTRALEKSVRSVFAFLGVDPTFVPRAQKSNVAGTPRFRSLHWILTRPHPLKRPARLLSPSLRNSLKRSLRMANLRPRRYERMPPEVEAQLRDEFAAEATQVAALLGRDLTATWPTALGLAAQQ